MRILSFVFLFILAVNVSAQSIDDLFSEGTRHANAARYDAALKSYKTALTVAEKKYAGNEYLARLHFNIGVCYFHLDQFKLAASEFKSRVAAEDRIIPAHTTRSIWRKLEDANEGVSCPRNTRKGAKRILPANSADNANGVSFIRVIRAISGQETFAPFRVFRGQKLSRAFAYFAGKNILLAIFLNTD